MTRTRAVEVAFLLLRSVLLGVRIDVDHPVPVIRYHLRYVVEFFVVERDSVAVLFHECG
jgi:hypothetical protein